MDKIEDTESLLFSTEQIITEARSKGRFRIHVLIALGIAVLCVGVWLITTFFTTNFPWFVYPIAVLGVTCSMHFYIFIRPREWLQFHVACFLIINAMLFLTWLFTEAESSSQDYQPWFLFSMFGLAIPLAIHYSAKVYKNSNHRWFYVHSSFFLSLNLLCLVIWLDDKGYPWWIIVFLSLALPLVIHWAVHYHPGHGFVLHAAVFTDIQLLLFFIWASLPPFVFPFFVFPLFVWGLGLAMHYMCRKRKSQETSYSVQDVEATTPGEFEEKAPIGTFLYPQIPAPGQNPFNDPVDSNTNNTSNGSNAAAAK
jgi:hypothetical protein